jgi:hypothetical protein
VGSQHLPFQLRYCLWDLRPSLDKRTNRLHDVGNDVILVAWLSLTAKR